MPSHKSRFAWHLRETLRSWPWQTWSGRNSGDASKPHNRRPAPAWPGTGELRGYSLQVLDERVVRGADSKTAARSVERGPLTRRSKEPPKKMTRA